ncbi:MAG: WXG100 family type VII secretion target [Hespellia sp.]|nr:WXG100 family type VII secretion target [Hespellia sp.]
MGVIEFDFAKAHRQASQLENLGRQMQSMTDSAYGNTMQILSSSWKGAAAETYMKKAARQQEKMRQTAKQLCMTAEALRMAANTVRAAEEKAKELAELRTART